MRLFATIQAGGSGDAPGWWSHREDRFTKEQRDSVVSMCFVPQGFMGQWLGPLCHEVERLWSSKWAELPRSLGIDVVIAAAHVNPPEMVVLEDQDCPPLLWFLD